MSEDVSFNARLNDFHSILPLIKMESLIAINSLQPQLTGLRIISRANQRSSFRFSRSFVRLPSAANLYFKFCFYILLTKPAEARFDHF